MQDSEDAGPKFSLRLGLWTLLVLSCALSGFFQLFTTFSIYDDEGDLMIATARLFSGVPLYKEQPGYGPIDYVYQAIARSPWAWQVHSNGTRWISLFEWLTISALLSRCAWRTKPSQLLSATTFFLAFISQRAHAAGPGHPQGLCLMLFGLAALALLEAQGRPRAGAFTAGACAAALLLVKINIGVFVACGLLLSLNALQKKSALERWILRLVGLIACALPLALFWRHLSEPWTQGLLGAYALGLALFARLCRKQAAGPASQQILLWGSLGLLSGIFVDLASNYAFGATLEDWLQSQFTERLRFSAAAYFTRPTFLPPTILILSPFLALTPWLLRGQRTAPLAPLKITLGLVTIGLIIFEKFALLDFMALPLSPLLMSSSERSAERTSLVTLTHALLAYPVAGAQLAWAVLPLSLFAPLLVASAFDQLQLSPRLKRVSPPAATAGLLLISLMLRPDQTGSASAWLQNQSLALPGANLLHLSPAQTRDLRWASANLATHSKSFLTAPGLNSYYFWTGFKAPTTLTSSAWPIDTSHETQEKLYQSIAISERPAILINAQGLEFWMLVSQKFTLPTQPLLDRFDADFDTRLQLGDLRILFPKSRRGEDLPEQWFSQTMSFGAQTPPLSMAGSATLQKSEWTLPCWIRPRTEGLILSDPKASQGLSFNKQTWTLGIGDQARSLPGKLDAWNSLAITKQASGLRLNVNEQADSSELREATLLSEWGLSEARFELTRLQLDRRALSQLELQSRLGAAPKD